MINMTRYTPRIILHILTACCLVVCVGSSCASVHKGLAPDKQYISSEHELIDVLLSTNVDGARVYFESSCKSDQKPNLLTMGSLPFPRIGIQPAPGARSPLVVARQMFLGASNVSTNTNDNGLFVIEIGNVNKSILETKIDSIRLNSAQRYNPQLAIEKILDFSTVQETENRLHLFLLSRPMDSQIVSPAPGLLHLPVQIRSTTLDKALDTVASTFHGIVIFGVCNEWGVYDVRFVATSAGNNKGVKQ